MDIENALSGFRTITQLAFDVRRTGITKMLPHTAIAPGVLIQACSAQKK